MLLLSLVVLFLPILIEPEGRVDDQDHDAALLAQQGDGGQGQAEVVSSGAHGEAEAESEDQVNL